MSKELTLPNNRKIFVKQDGGMAYISISAASLDRLHRRTRSRFWPSWLPEL